MRVLKVLLMNSKFIENKEYKYLIECRIEENNKQCYFKNPEMELYLYIPNKQPLFKGKLTEHKPHKLTIEHAKKLMDKAKPEELIQLTGHIYFEKIQVDKYTAELKFYESEP